MGLKASRNSVRIGIYFNRPFVKKIATKAKIAKMIVSKYRLKEVIVLALPFS